jgi:DNA-binding protein HU-beta
MADLRKPDVVDAVAAETGLSKAQTEATLNALEHVVTETVKGGGSVVITGFVTFKVQHQPARTGVAMGKPWSRPAGKVVKARVGGKLKAAV